MRRKLLELGLRGLFKPVVGLPLGTRFHRAWIGMLAASNLPARGVDYCWERVDGVSVEIVTPRAAAVGNLLYLHGGAFVMGAPGTHRAITSQLARRGWRVVVPDYRLAPEHPWPAAVEDAAAVWRALCAEPGAEGHPPALAGDSAGGGLALCLAQRLRDDGETLPAALALISPWVDLGNDRPSHSERARRDPMLHRAWLNAAVKAYIQGQGEPSDRRWSPIYGSVEGLPPTCIHVGSEEILHDDALALSVALQDAGVHRVLRVYEGLWHVFHLHAAVLPEADAAIAELAAFLQRPMRSAAAAEA